MACRRERGFSVIELMLATAILGLLMAFALRMYQPAIAKAEVMNTFSASSEERMRVHEHYAVTGEWLGAGSLAEEATKPPGFGRLEDVRIDRGAVTVTFDQGQRAQLRGTAVTLRPLVVPDGRGVSLSWSCGYAETASGLEMPGENRTDIPPLNLPLSCR